MRGIARMIERDEYCVDILQQTAALKAAVDAVSIMILEDHIQGCVRTRRRARRGGQVRRRGGGRRPPDARPAGPRDPPDGLIRGYPQRRRCTARAGSRGQLALTVARRTP